MKPLIVHCPCCGVEIDIDRRSGKIVRTGPKPGEEETDRFAAAFGQVKDLERKTASAFDQVTRAVKGREEELDDVFRSAVKKVKETDDGSRPFHPLDMD